ncbi:hypothetical protein MCOR27_002192 [Pyricularia oryzae]|uniref:Uncharacterized protein n=4 Tax=Pyricularia oryzae TaxID=318829 RepID=G4NI14_PYRO7|nr:uncharacterized protein MGG_17794 [Pyricularia oryzae 70-15]ELQ39783.1 hypothetical protein OOU_Y34scaffold00485g24 [Pyricularia oryzae Y34]KAH9432151.1 hypothetical protein MCOR02_006856 [Pyricularia oryzae]EHA47874.1 hypothetical protein MGG_17794 [Pyricularia oryzae 70-15]KAI6252202.1 hypothetical protein MCOR19_011183 [Pyricularia oryzae]KAI6272708.1 hypothetical protein MCOR26_007243 [Pyricularia oryzae]
MARRFSLSSFSPAKKAENRVMGDRHRRSVDTTATSSTIGHMPVVDASHHLPQPSWAKTIATRT